jgi:hypothetical protein
MFSYLSPEQWVPRDHPLRAIRAITDPVLQELSRAFDRLYAANGCAAGGEERGGRSEAELRGTCADGKPNGLIGG